jgi:hypothetical protein
VIPLVRVANYGAEPESVMVKMVIDQSGMEQYRDSLVIGSLPPGSHDTVELTGWIPDGRDSMTATAWTECATDTFPLNDTARARFLVRVTDVAVTDIIVPVGTLESGLVVYPEAIVWNYGNVTDTIPVRFEIGAYVSTCTLYSSGHAVAPDPYYTMPGTYVHRVTALFPDRHPENNTMVDTFYVRRTTRHDVGVLRILAPTDTIDTGTVVTPAARVGNFGSQPETFWAWFYIYDSTGTVFYPGDSMQVMVSGNDSLDVAYWPWSFSPGWYVAVSQTYMLGDSNPQNDIVRDTFWVVARPGVAESGQPPANSAQLSATIVRGVLNLGSGLGHNPNSRARSAEEGIRTPESGPAPQAAPGIGLCPAPRISTPRTMVAAVCELPVVGCRLSSTATALTGTFM